MTEISFDDLLGDFKPKQKTSIKVSTPKIAGKKYSRPEIRETPANWNTPSPEVIILFWSETVCNHCGETHSHPTYQQNSTMVRYRVSRFRTLLRPYSNGDELRYTHLPRIRETIQSKVRYCKHCFDEHVFSVEQFDKQLQFVGPPEPIKPLNIPCSEIEKPFAEVDYTESELHHK